MSNILNSKDFGLKIYNRFPPKYREDDVEQKYALKRYIQSLSETCSINNNYDKYIT